MLSSQSGRRDIFTSNTPTSVAYDGEFLWITHSIPGTVTKVNKTTGAIVNTVVIGTQLRSICFDGTFIWVANYNSVTKLVAATGALVGQYPLANTGGFGAAFDGVNVWVISINGNKIQKF
jgi:hypothetical protein